MFLVPHEIFNPFALRKGLPSWDEEGVPQCSLLHLALNYITFSLGWTLTVINISDIGKVTTCVQHIVPVHKESQRLNSITQVAGHICVSETIAKRTLVWHCSTCAMCMHTLAYSVLAYACGIVFQNVWKLVSAVYLAGLQIAFYQHQGSAKLQLLQDAWTECQGEWRKSSLYKRITQRSSVSQRGARVWMTRAQIARKVWKSWDVANEICNSKVGKMRSSKQTHTKPHPDAPNNEVGTGCVFNTWHPVLLDRVFVAQSTCHIIRMSYACYFNCIQTWFSTGKSSPLDERCHSIDGDCFLKKNQLSCNLPMPKKIPKIPK